MEHNYVKIIDPNGNKDEVELLLDFKYNNNNYLIYKKDLTDDDIEDECFVVKMKRKGLEMVISEIEDDNEYNQVLDVINEIIKEG